MLRRVESVEGVVRTLPILGDFLGRSGRLLEDVKDNLWVGPEASSADVKSPSQSMLKWRIPFRSSLEFRERYRLFDTDRIRIGRLLEALDAFSGDCAYRHAGGVEDRTIVTACLDRLDLFSRHFSLNSDLQLVGRVVCVGSSSMDVRVDVFAEEEYVGKADFLFVSRDKVLNRAKPVPKLLITSQEEKDMEREYSLHRSRRKAQSESSIWKVPPSSEESRLMHELFSQSQKDFQRGTFISLRDSGVDKTVLMQKQHRNVHNKIFGGHLMREAYELAWICAYRFGRCYPLLQCVDDILFLKPVEVGSIVTFKSELAYVDSSRTSAVVNVEAIVEDALTGAKSVTNTFHFLFTFSSDCAQIIPNLLPETYQDALKFFEGRRRFLAIKKA